MESKIRRARRLEARRLKSLEDENRRLKKLLAESMLYNAALKDLLGKKRLKPAARRETVMKVMERHGLSQRRACELSGWIVRLCATGADDRTNRH